jgi:hypothetical protein
MQLDKTAIEIAQRSGVEMVDLSFIVMRRYWRSIAIVAILGIVPFAIADFILLWPLTRYESLVMTSRDITDVSFFHLRYLSIVTALILIQAPLALCGVTYFIGQAVFIERPSVRQVMSCIWARCGAMVLILGILRMSLVAFIPVVVAIVVIVVIFIVIFAITRIVGLFIIFNLDFCYSYISWRKKNFVSLVKV